MNNTVRGYKWEEFGQTFMRVEPTVPIMKGMIKQVVEEGRFFAVNLESGYLTIRSEIPKTQIDMTVRWELKSATTPMKATLYHELENSKSLMRALMGLPGWERVYIVACRLDKTGVGCSQAGATPLGNMESLLNGEYEKLWKKFLI
jgi:hypothetical protein